MIPLAKKASPAAIAVLRQATAIWPKRKKAADGLLPSKAHQKQNPNSDHNSGMAVDLTHDPANGVDCKDIFNRLKTDVRVKYLIHAGRIYQDGHENNYSGPNKHEHHLHISIKDNCGNQNQNWFPWVNQTTQVKKNTIKISQIKQPKKKPVKTTTQNDSLRKRSVLVSFFKRGK